MGHDAIGTVVILVGVLVLLITEWVPPGITGLITILVLALTGIVPSADAFSALTNDAIVTIACMYVVSTGIARTGAAAAIANRIADRGGSALTTYHALLLVTLVFSAFVNNTPLVLIFMPLVLGLASRMGEAPSRLLIPLSFLSILGGMCTLIGTSTNLIVASSLQEASKGALHIDMFDFSRLGVVLAFSGALLVLVFRRKLLPIRPSLGILTRQGVAVEYMTEVEIGEGSPLEGQAIEQVLGENLLGEAIQILEVVRGDVIRVPRRSLHIQKGDLLVVKGTPEAILELRQSEERRVPGASDSVRRVAMTLFEVVVTPNSPWIGQRISGLELHDRYGISVLALQRHGSHLREKIGRVRLVTGDVLLVQGPQGSLERMRTLRSVLVVEGVEHLMRDSRKAPLSIAILVSFVALAVTGLVSIPVSALLAALLMVLTGCLSTRAAYESIGWDVLFLLGGTLTLGYACERTGLAEATAQAVLLAAEPFGLRAVLAVLLIITTLLTQVLSNNAAAALMTPLAYHLGVDFEGASPMPFVMAVAFGANCSFLTPVSYNTNLLIYGPGGYRFRDFFRPGLPLTVLYITLATLLLPVLY